MEEGSQFHFIAAFTTCNARLKLYESLDTLQHQVLYYDTDSVIYKWKQGQVEPGKDSEDQVQQREIIAIFHNLKGFDSVFIVNELYNQQRSVENGVKGERPTKWYCSGAILVTMCFKSRFECPCKNHSKVLGGWIVDL